MIQIKILGIDPGSEQSAVVLVDFDTMQIEAKKMLDNQILAKLLLLDEYNIYTYLGIEELNIPGIIHHIAIEQIASYGMPVGADIFKTCGWSYIFWYLSGLKFSTGWILRRNVKWLLCNSAKAKDANVAQALRDIFGIKKGQHGFNKHFYAALGVAYTYYQKIKENQINKDKEL